METQQVKTRSLRLGLTLCAGLLAAFGVALACVPLKYPIDSPTLAMLWVLTGSTLVAASLVSFVLIRLLTHIALNHIAMSQHHHETLQDLRRALMSQGVSLDSIRESAGISEATKRIVFRHKDREALQRAISEDLAKGEYAIADALVDEMERRFGYKDEARLWREEIQRGLHQRTEREVQAGLSQVENMVNKGEWRACRAEIDRLINHYPDHEEIRNLPGRLQQIMDQNKRQLLKQWHEAVSRDDVDVSVELLRQMDPFLTPSEAEAFKESARDIFRKKLQQLGAQFALHVQDKEWYAAHQIGLKIIEEFPNTRIAAEVRDKLPILTAKIANKD